MSEYVVMPKEDWQDILNTTRNCTGNSALLKSNEVAKEIGKQNLTAELTAQDELLISIETMLGLSAAHAKAITTPEEFVSMDPDGAYYLANDITISTSVNLFRGTLYGNNKTVTTTVPLFNELDGATVFNLTVSGQIDKPGKDRVGALACSGSNVCIHHVTNLADVSGARQVAGIVGYVLGDPEFAWCVNRGNVYASERHVGGIVAVASEYVTMKYCANSGKVELVDSVSSSSDRYGAAGIVDWAGEGCLLYYCVNTGDVFSTFNAAGIGCYLSGENIIVEGCVNTGNIYSKTLSVAGIVRKAEGRAHITLNTIAGSLTADSGNASAVVHYNTSGSSSYQNNIVLLEQGDVRGIDEYLIAGTTGSIVTEQSESVSCVYAIEETFEYLFKPNGKSAVQIPNNYEYFFAKEDFASDADVKDIFGDVFSLYKGIPMHKNAVDVYRLLARSTSATLVVNFIDFYNEPRDTNGYYTIDEGEEVYFTNCTSITISEGLYIDSSVLVFIECRAFDELVFTVLDGCLEDFIDDTGSSIFVESENASATIQDRFEE